MSISGPGILDGYFNLSDELVEKFMSIKSTHVDPGGRDCVLSSS